jgi:hypothetical protein
MIVTVGQKVQSRAALNGKGNPTLIAIGVRAIPPKNGISTFVGAEECLRSFRRTSRKDPEKEPT